MMRGIFRTSISSPSLRLVLGFSVSPRPPCRCKLSQLVSHHLFADGHRKVVFAIIDHELDADEVGKDGGCSGFRKDGSIVLKMVREGRECGEERALPGRASKSEGCGVHCGRIACREDRRR